MRCLGFAVILRHKKLRYADSALRFACHVVTGWTKLQKCLMLPMCILLCMPNWNFQDDTAVHVDGNMCIKQKLAATAACWHASPYYMRTATHMLSKVTLLLTEQRAGLAAYTHEQNLHIVHSLQGKILQHLKVCIGNSLPVYMMRAKVQGTIKKATRAFPSALAFAASTVASPDRAAVPCKPFHYLSYIKD